MKAKTNRQNIYVYWPANSLLNNCSLGENYDKPRQHIKKQRHFANKGLDSQSYGFSSSHVGMWEFDHKEGWEPKN